MRVLAVLVVIAAGCGGDGGTGPDAGGLSDAASSSDASGGAGLTVMITPDPAVPGMVRNGVIVTSATFRVKTLEVIGDAGSGGTTLAGVRLDFSDTAQPPPFWFPGAPPGLYSKVTLDIDGDLAEPSLEILGMAQIGGGAMEPFRIVDTGRIEADVNGFDVTLAPNGTAVMPVRLDLRSVLDLEFDQLDNVAGVWTLDETSQMIDGFREEVEDAFKRGGGN